MSATRRGLTAGLVAAGLLWGAAPAEAACEPSSGTTHVFILRDSSYTELMGIPAVESLAVRGGSALLANADDLEDQARTLAQHPPVSSAGYRPDVALEDLGGFPQAPGERTAFAAGLQDQLSSIPPQDTVVVATVGTPSDGGRLNGIVIGWPNGASSGEPGVLTSDSTRRVGVVDGTDLEPTVLSLVCGSGTEIQDAITLQPTLGETSASPADILARHLDARRLAFPVQLVAGIAVLLITATGLGAFFLRDRAPGWVLSLGRWACLAAPVLGMSLLMAGHLPSLDYASVGAAIILPTLVAPALLLTTRRRSPLMPLLLLAVSLLVVMTFEAFTGWGATPYTMLGGTAFDGARFYGLPNAFIGIILGSCLYLASALPVGTGAALIVAGCFLAGLPSLGANLGGAITLAAGAGLWVALEGEGNRRWGGGLVVAAASLGIVVAAHLWGTSAPTHVTRLAEEGGGPLHLLGAAVDRLGIGLGLLQRSPVGILYLAGTPILLWFVARPRGGMVAVFEREPRWRHAMLAILWACVVAYFFNDTGVAAVGLGFAMALGGTLYVALASSPGKMAAP